MISFPYWEAETAALGSSPRWVPHSVSCVHRGVILGASVSHYLLETSRVVFQV